MKCRPALLIAFVILGILLAAPSLRLNWWMYLPALGAGVYLLGPSVLAVDILLIGSLPVWAIVMEVLLSDHGSELKYLFGYWWPQVVTYILARAVATVAPTRVLNIWFVLMLVAIFGFVGMESVGLDPHAILPSYKDVDAVNTFEEFTYYSGEYRRLRAFFGEASVLSGVVVLMASMVLASRWTSKLLAPALSSLANTSSILVVLAAIMLLPFVLSKAGLIIAAIGVVGYGLRWLRSAQLTARWWTKAFISLGALVAVAITVFLIAPTSIRNYFQTEVYRANVGLAGGGSELGNTGLYSRYDHWLLTLQCVAHYPLGSGTVGIGESYDNPEWFTRNREMDRRIPMGVFGLLNQWANVAAQTGLYGLAIVVFVLGYHFRNRGDPALRWLLCTELIVFFFTVETYPYLALVPIAAAALGQKPESLLNAATPFPR